MDRVVLSRRELIGSPLLTDPQLLQLFFWLCCRLDGNGDLSIRQIATSIDQGPALVLFGLRTLHDLRLMDVVFEDDNRWANVTVMPSAATVESSALAG